MSLFKMLAQTQSCFTAGTSLRGTWSRLRDEETQSHRLHSALAGVLARDRTTSPWNARTASPAAATPVRTPLPAGAAEPGGEEWTLGAGQVVRTWLKCIA